MNNSSDARTADFQQAFDKAVEIQNRNAMRDHAGSTAISVLADVVKVIEAVGHKDNTAAAGRAVLVYDQLGELAKCYGIDFDAEVASRIEEHGLDVPKGLTPFAVALAIAAEAIALNGAMSRGDNDGVIRIAINLGAAIDALIMSALRSGEPATMTTATAQVEAQKGG